MVVKNGKYQIKCVVGKITVNELSRPLKKMEHPRKWLINNTMAWKLKLFSYIRRHSGLEGVMTECEISARAGSRPGKIRVFIKS